MLGRQPKSNQIATTMVAAGGTGDPPPNSSSSYHPPQHFHFSSQQELQDMTFYQRGSGGSVVKPPLTSNSRITVNIENGDMIEISHHEPKSSYASMTHDEALPDTGSDDDSSTMDGVDVLSPAPPPKNFVQWTHFRAGRIVTHPKVKRGVLCLVMFHCAVMALCTWSEVRKHVGLLKMLHTIMFGILILFSAEVLLDLIHFQGKTWQRGWVVLDVILVSWSWATIETATLGTSLLVFRGFRFIRALRKATGLEAVRDVVKALLYAAPRLVACAFLLVIILLLFAIFFAHFYATEVDIRRFESSIPDNYFEGSSYENVGGNRFLTSTTEQTNSFIDMDDGESENAHVDSYFQSIPVTILTLFQVMTGGRSWSVISNDLRQQSGPETAVLLMVSFVGTATFAFGGMMVAILVHALSITMGPKDGFVRGKKGTGKNKHSPSTASWTTSTTSHSLDEQHQIQYRQHLERTIENMNHSIQHLVTVQTNLQQTVNKLLQEQQKLQQPPTLRSQEVSSKPVTDAERAGISSSGSTSGIEGTSWETTNEQPSA